MGLYGKNGYYFYVKLEEGSGFVPNEVMTLYNTNANGTPTTRFQEDKISKYMCLRFVETTNPLYSRVEFVAIRESDDLNNLNPAVPLFEYGASETGQIADPFTTNLVLVGANSGTIAFLRGPGYGGKIWTEAQVYQGVKNVAIGEVDYDPQRHDLFNWFGDDRLYVKTNDNGVPVSPINQDFYAGTPFSPSEMDYSCLPVLSRFPSQPTPYMGTTSVNSCLISRQHLIAAAHFWSGTGQSLSFYDPTTNQYHERTVVASAGYDLPNPSSLLGFPASLVEMMRYLGVQINEDLHPLNANVWLQNMILESLGLTSQVNETGPLPIIFNDLELLLLDSPLPEGVKPASLPLVPKTSKVSRVGCGVMIDANQRGYVFNVDSSSNFFASSLETAPVYYCYSQRISAPIVGDRYLLRSYPVGVSENDTQNFLYVGDSSSITLARYGEKTLFWGCTLNGNAGGGRSKLVSTQDGLVTNPNDAFDKEGIYPSNHGSGISFWLANFCSLPPGDIPNTLYRNPSALLGIQFLEGIYGVGNIPPNVMTPAFIDFIRNTPVISESTIPSALRDIPSLITQFVNKWSRDVLGPSYQDVALDWFTITDDCPYEPCYQFSYDGIRFQSRLETPERTPELPFWRAPLERSSRSVVFEARPPSIPPIPTTYDVLRAQGVTLA